MNRLAMAFVGGKSNVQAHQRSLAQRAELISAHHQPSFGRYGMILAVLVLAAVAIARMASTYAQTSLTFDEPVTFAAGMSWLDRDGYFFSDHPPLARIVAAIGPYLAGARMPERELDPRFPSLTAKEVGYAVLLTDGAYLRNLTLWRLGNLPFFIGALALVGWWAKRLCGPAAAVAAVAVLTLCPMFLGHSSLATLDLAVSTFTLAGIVTFVSWLELPSRARAALLGLSWGLAVLSKLSAILFLPICAAAIVLWCWLFNHVLKPATARAPGLTIRHLKSAFLCGGVCFLVMWAGYKFSLAPLVDPAFRPHHLLDRLFGANETLHNLSYSIVERVPLPMPEFINGFIYQMMHDKEGHMAFLFNKYSQSGWWYFFPVVLFFKLPLALIGLLSIGTAYTAVAVRRNGQWQLALPIICALVILLAAMQSNINNGTRQILVLYPLISITCGFAVVRLWNEMRPVVVGRGLTVVLLGWLLAASVSSHPDYLAYFNELTPKPRDKVVADSDLDWGQDVHRLATELRARNIDSVHLVIDWPPPPYNHTLYSAVGLPHVEELLPCSLQTGWIAISSYWRRDVEGPPSHDRYSWLERFEPVARIGETFFLYHVPADAELDLPAGCTASGHGSAMAGSML